MQKIKKRNLTKYIEIICYFLYLKKLIKNLKDTKMSGGVKDILKDKEKLK